MNSVVVRALYNTFGDENNEYLKVKAAVYAQLWLLQSHHKKVLVLNFKFNLSTAIGGAVLN